MKHASNHFGLPQRALAPRGLPPEHAAASARIDLIIAVFAFGVILGFLIGGGS